MSMVWMRMPGQSWLDVGSAFLGMWMVMMAAMMLPSLVPMLRRYRGAVAADGQSRLGRLTALVAGGYFFVWGLLGIVAFLVGAVLMSLQMQHPAVARLVPALVAPLVVGAGAFQLSAWKARQLTCCRTVWAGGEPVKAAAPVAWRSGLRLGITCARCCSNLMLILIVIGVMDLRVMAAVVISAGLILLARSV